MSWGNFEPAFFPRRRTPHNKPLNLTGSEPAVTHFLRRKNDGRCYFVFWWVLQKCRLWTGCRGLPPVLRERQWQ